MKILSILLVFKGKYIYDIKFKKIFFNVNKPLNRLQVINYECDKHTLFF